MYEDLDKTLENKLSQFKSNCFNIEKKLSVTVLIVLDNKLWDALNPPNFDLEETLIHTLK